MGDRLALITGATDGIGRQTAVELARLGIRVLLHGRSRERVAEAGRMVRKESASDAVEEVVADFSRLDEVRALAAELQSRFPDLTVLINNAGVYMREHHVTPDGLETTFAVNHLAPFLLTNLLLPQLRKNSARIINVSSVAHTRARLDFGNLQGERGYDAYGAYALSKLANVMCTYDLAGMLAGSGATANALHPGVISTKLLHTGFSVRGAPLSQGAGTPVFLAVSLDVEGISGKYFVNKREEKSAAITYDRDARQRLWEISASLVGLKD